MICIIRSPLKLQAFADGQGIRKTWYDARKLFGNVDGTADGIRFIDTVNGDQHMGSKKLASPY